MVFAERHGDVDFKSSRIYNVSRLNERYEIAYEATWVGMWRFAKYGTC